MIIRAVKINTSKISEGQSDIIGYTISCPCADGEFIPMINKNVDTTKLNAANKKIVDDFVAFMSTQLVENNGGI